MVQGDANGDETTVPVVTLDEELKEIPFIDVLKIDTEGADTWVLEGAQELLRQKRIGNVFFEENKSRMEQLGIGIGRAREVLVGCGYSLLPLGSSGTEYHATPHSS